MNGNVTYIKDSNTNELNCLPTFQLSNYILTQEEQQYLQNLSDDTTSTISLLLLTASTKAGSSLYTQPALNKLYMRRDSEDYKSTDKDMLRKFLNANLVGNDVLKFDDLSGAVINLAGATNNNSNILRSTTSSSSSSSSSSSRSSSNGTYFWTGSGKFNTFKDLGRSNESSSKKVVISGSFKANKWSGGNKEQDSGFCFVSKGLVGDHWGVFLCVRPNGLMWGSTKGEVVAPCTISLGKEYSIKAEAYPNKVSFWLNGKLIKVLSNPYSSPLIRNSSQPLRLGGYYCPYPSATFFNQSINGTITNAKIEMS